MLTVVTVTLRASSGIIAVMVDGQVIIHFSILS